MSDFYKMKRGWHDSEFFGRDEYSRRDAWSWMVGQARWKDKTGVGETIKRGEFSHSIRFMADKFRWSKGRVERFLEALKNRDMIHVKTGTQTRTGQLVITICNYSEYQDDKRKTGTDMIEKRDSNRDKEEECSKEKEKNITLRGMSKPTDVSAQVWDDFLQIRKLHKAAVTETALKGIRREAEKAGLSLDGALQIVCTQGWRGFRADWVTKEKTKSTSTWKPGQHPNEGVIL
jgi:hypothetical protein